MNSNISNEQLADWRQFTDQLTARQIRQYERRERLYPDLTAEYLAGQARDDVERNHVDRERFGHIEDPTGAEVLHHWEINTDKGGWRRLFEGRQWNIGGVDCRIVGEQLADGTVAADLSMVAGVSGVDLSAGELRELAAAMIEAADELDTIWAVGTS